MKETKRFMKLAGIEVVQKPPTLSENQFLPEKPKLDPNEYLNIDTPLGGGDFELFKSVVNQGIDSHLEGFTKSKFQGFMQDGQKRMCFNFHKSELPILLRRLDELGEKGNEEADSWASSIRQEEGLEDEYGSPIKKDVGHHGEDRVEPNPSIHEVKKVKLSALSEGLRKEVKKLVKEGKTKLSQFPNDVKKRVLKEYRHR